MRIGNFETNPILAGSVHGINDHGRVHRRERRWSQGTTVTKAAPEEELARHLQDVFSPDRKLLPPRRVCIGSQIEKTRPQQQIDARASYASCKRLPTVFWRLGARPAPIFDWPHNPARNWLDQQLNGLARHIEWHQLPAIPSASRGTAITRTNPTSGHN